MLLSLCQIFVNFCSVLEYENKNSFSGFMFVNNVFIFSFFFSLIINFHSPHLIDDLTYIH